MYLSISSTSLRHTALAVLLGTLAEAASAAPSHYQCLVRDQQAGSAANAASGAPAPSRRGQWFAINRGTGVLSGPLPAIEAPDAVNHVKSDGLGGGSAYELLLGDPASGAATGARVLVNEQDAGVVKRFVATAADGSQLSGDCL